MSGKHDTPTTDETPLSSSDQETPESDENLDPSPAETVPTKTDSASPKDTTTSNSSHEDEDIFGYNHIDPSQPNEGGGFEWMVGTWDGRAFALSFLIPFIVFTIFISPDITFGDGPEILGTTVTRGVIHPSGYPLYTLLGQLFVHLPGPSAHWWLSFGLSAIPQALTSALLYIVSRRLGASPIVALPMSVALAFNDVMLMLGSRVEVYAVTNFFVGFALYSYVRFWQDPKAFKWACLATLGTSLALGVHLTSAFLLIPMIVGLLLVNWRLILEPKNAMKLIGIGLVCGLVYLYFPITSNLHQDGSAVLWNEPNTWDRFWYHVRGAEYDGFRKPKKLFSRLQRFAHIPRRMFFAGLLLLIILGLIESVLKRWKPALVLFLFGFSLILYTSIYDIGDIATYYGPIFFVGLCFGAVGTEWILRARFPKEWFTDRRGVAIILLLCMSIPGSLLWRNRWRYYQDILAEAMSDQTVAKLPEKVIMFTAVDGHSFPMWYQSYVKHPEMNIPVVDRYMFGGHDKLWYRNFLRRRHPEVTWPTEEEVKKKKRKKTWEEWIIENNKDRYKFAALLAKPWLVRGSYNVNRGWHHDIIPSDNKADKKDKGTQKAMHIYLGVHHPVGKRNYFSDSHVIYKAKEERIACITEWWKHDDLDARWTIRGPNGKVINFKNHPIPANSNISWEYLEIKDQEPGEWECEVVVKKGDTLKLKFLLE